MSLSCLKNPSKFPILHRGKATLLIRASKVLYDLPTSLRLFCWSCSHPSSLCPSHVPNVFAQKACALSVPSAWRALSSYHHKIVSFLTFQLQPKCHLFREDFPIAFLHIATFSLSIAFIIL